VATRHAPDAAAAALSAPACRRHAHCWPANELQEDDEFEEFEEQEWAQGDGDVEDPTMWQVRPC
jgi:hypothetical protein